MSYYTDIRYNVRRVIRSDGKTVWRAYENDHCLDEFMSEERAWNYIETYRRLMR